MTQLPLGGTFAGESKESTPSSCDESARQSFCDVVELAKVANERAAEHLETPAPRDKQTVERLAEEIRLDASKGWLTPQVKKILSRKYPGEKFTLVNDTDLRSCFRESSNSSQPSPCVERAEWNHRYGSSADIQKLSRRGKAYLFLTYGERYPHLRDSTTEFEENEFWHGRKRGNPSFRAKRTKEVNRRMPGNRVAKPSITLDDSQRFIISGKNIRAAVMKRCREEQKKHREARMLAENARAKQNVGAPPGNNVGAEDQAGTTSFDAPAHPALIHSFEGLSLAVRTKPSSADEDMVIGMDGLALSGKGDA